MKIKLLFLSIYLIACPWLAFSQAGEWTWVSGVNTTGFTGTFGTQGVPSPTNSPPGVYEACEWKDHQGNFWFFGGKNYPNSKYWGDLWRYNPVTNEWTWMTGTSLSNAASSYGVRGIASASNAPGERGYGAMTWTDTTGNLWMFGGYETGFKNDIWKYDISTNLWTWMNGDTTAGTPNFGTQGIPSPSNKPPGLSENACTWLDRNNNLWLFGGSATLGSYCDVWKYDISANEWTWVIGTGIVSTLPTYGTLGVPDSNNTPGGRWAYSHWTNDSIHFWTFGGSGSGDRNDMWMFNSITSEWTWMNGPNTLGDTGSFGTQCSPDVANAPSARMENRSSVTDNCGNFWFYGGSGVGGSSGMKSDLWKYDPVINEWTFISPANRSSTPIYGTQGIASPTNIPGGRMGAIAWMDSLNNYWLYGGFGDSYVTYGDLWRYASDSSCGGTVCNIQPPVALFHSSDTTFCTESGKCINFFDQSTGNPTSWNWTFFGATPSTSTQQNPTNICYYTPGTYPVILIVSNSHGTDTLNVYPMIIFGTAPPPPTVTVSGDTLYCTSAQSYQWYFNGAPIAGAVDSFYVATQSGTYSAQITDNGCAVLSNGVNVTITSVMEHANSEIKIFPNPAKDLVEISGLREKAAIEMYNVLGEKVYSFQSEIKNPKSAIQLDISSLARSVYFISITQANTIYRSKIVKQ